MIESKSIYELFGIEKEQLQFYIDNKLLCEQHINLIKTHFDDDFRKLKDVKWSYEENQMYYISIKKRIKNLAKRSSIINYSPKTKFLDIIGISIEEFLKIKSILPMTIQKFIEEHFDENLDFKRPYHLWGEEEKNFYDNRVITYTKRVIKPTSQSKFSPLTLRTGTTPEELNEIIPLLSKKSQELIARCYRSDFYPYADVELNPEEIDYFRRYTIVRIKELASRPNPEYKYNVYKDLPKRLGITVLQFKFILSFIPKYDQKLIRKYYDENYVLKEGLELSKNAKRSIAIDIFPLLKWQIKNYGLDIISENYKKEEETEIIHQEINETYSLNNSFNIDYHKLYIYQIKNSEELPLTEKTKRIKAMRKIYQEYKHQLLEEKHMTLVRKKD